MVISRNFIINSRLISGNSVKNLVVVSRNFISILGENFKQRKRNEFLFVLDLTENRFRPRTDEQLETKSGFV